MGQLQHLETLHSPQKGEAIYFFYFLHAAIFSEKAMAAWYRFAKTSERMSVNKTSPKLRCQAIQTDSINSSPPVVKHNGGALMIWSCFSVANMSFRGSGFSI